MSKTKCNECGSSDLEWNYGNKITSGVVHGRLNTNDVKTFFYLGCRSCSATVRAIDCDDVVAILDQRQTSLD